MGWVRGISIGIVSSNRVRAAATIAHLLKRRLVQSPCQSFRRLCFCGGRRKWWRCYVQRDLSSIQRKTGKKKTWRPKVCSSQTGYEQNQKATCCCSCLGRQNEVTFVGWISERRPKNELFVFTKLFSIQGPYIYLVLRKEGEREGRWHKAGTNRSIRQWWIFIIRFVST